MLENIKLLLSNFNNLDCYLFTTLDGKNERWDFYFKNKQFLVGKHKSDHYKEFTIQNILDFIIDEDISLENFETVLFNSFLIKHYNWTLKNTHQFQRKLIESFVDTNIIYNYHLGMSSLFDNLKDLIKNIDKDKKLKIIKN